MLAGLLSVLLAFATSPAGTTREDGYASKALGGRLPFTVYLPSGYGTSGKRYPVIYFLHGLPASPYAYRGSGFIARALEERGAGAIIVSPQGARDGDHDPEYLDWGPGRNWETAIAEELPRYVDSRYRTIRDRRARALVGLSAGGYGATLLALHHLERFSAIESWSGYFRPTDPSGRFDLDLGSEVANAQARPHTFVRSLRAAFRRRPTFFAFYVGSRDSRFRVDNERLDAELTAARVPHLFRVYPGAHEQSLWTAHAADWIELALGHLRRARAAADPAALVPASFHQIEEGPAGGSIWQGPIPDPGVPALRRPALVYLPPNAARGKRYPVVYLLEGFPGSPYEFSDGLQLADEADTAIANGDVPGFIAVVPPAGVTARYNGEWTGTWENYVVDDVVPWVDLHLPTEAAPAGRAIAGLSAGGYGAVDIGLRHPTVFGTLEAWSGYFHPFRDGSLRRANRAELRAHDPSALAREKAKQLRRLGTHFFLSSGTTADQVSAGLARRFAAELASLGLPYELWLRPGGHDGRFWRAQLGPALRYALLR
jgi:enterochelin esterase-like enzyme